MKYLITYIIFCYSKSLNHYKCNDYNYVILVARYVVNIGEMFRDIVVKLCISIRLLGIRSRTQQCSNCIGETIIVMTSCEWQS